MRRKHKRAPQRGGASRYQRWGSLQRDRAAAHRDQLSMESRTARRSGQTPPSAAEDVREASSAGESSNASTTPTSSPQPAHASSLRAGKSARPPQPAHAFSCGRGRPPVHRSQHTPSAAVQDVHQSVVRSRRQPSAAGQGRPPVRRSSPRTDAAR